MPEIDYAFLCDHARVEGGLGYVIAAGVDTLYVPEVPSGANIALLMRVSFTRNECDRPHRIEVIIQDTDGARIGVINGTATPQWIPDLPPGWRVGTMTAFNMGLPLPHYGEYSIEILVNDGNARSIDFRVIPPRDTGQAEGGAT